MDENGEETNKDELHFFYDSQSRPAFVEYNGEMYRYIHNLQGDIVGIVDAEGTLVVEYKYDAWGKPVSTTGSLANTLGDLNPFRYRGYVYDTETGFYYLKSRCYNPSITRFINADIYLGGAVVDSHNIYLYCSNAIVNRVDYYGYNWEGIKNWFSQKCESVERYIQSVKEKFILAVNLNAQQHYNRNPSKQDYDIEYIIENYTKVSEWADKYHENTDGLQGADAKYNDKYLSPNGGHDEIIICSPPDKDPYIVDESVDPSNMGTPNYASKDQFFLIYWAEHFDKDMMPYYLFGNTRNDNKGCLKFLLY